MLTIRLTRVGKRKQPTYRFIVSEKARDPWGRALEILGHYNPRTNPTTLVVKEDRVKHWISKGAQLSDTVWNLFVDQKLVEGEKRRKVNLSTRRKEKLAKKNEAKAAQEAAKAEKAKAEAAAAQEAPSEPPADATPEAPAA